MVSDKKQYSMNEIIHKLLTTYDAAHIAIDTLPFKLENIET